MNGIIVINKPKGCTSHDVVSKVKKILNVKKVGHTGTLDPNATGVLPLLLNDGTKLSKYLIDHDKEYIVTLKLGIKTDSADGEGKIIEERDIENINEEIIKSTLKCFIGKQEQIPPMYSAIKVNGKKLYEYARSGESVELKPRQIEIYNIEFINYNKNENEVEYKVSCSKGTYIRSLCEDISAKLGTIGYMKELKRTKVGQFNIDNSITIDELEEKRSDIDFIYSHIITIEELFREYPKVDLDNNELSMFLNGVKLDTKNEDGTYNIYNNNSFVGLGIVGNGKLKRDLIIN